MAKEDASDAPSQHAVEFPVRKSDSSAALEMIANVNEAIVRRSQSQRLSELQKDTSNTEAVEAVSSLLKLNWVKIVPSGYLYYPNRGISDLFLLV